MSFASDLRILYHLAFKPPRGRTQAERMDSFYRGQAEGYDAFRRRLLPGREELVRRIRPPAGAVGVDMGGGTAANVECLGSEIDRMKSLYVVDLSSSLIDVARRRVARRGWTNVRALVGDATTFRPAEGQADVVTFSYALTMMPDWFAALEHAAAILRPGGWIGVVDFYVSRKHPPSGLAAHGW